MAVRHLVSFQYAPTSPFEQRKAFETSLQSLPSQLPSILEYHLGQTCESHTDAYHMAFDHPHVPMSGDFHVLVEATFKDNAAYLSYRDSNEHKAVCPAFRPILTGRAALQCDSSEMIQIDVARAAGANLSVVVFAQLRDGIAPGDLEKAIAKVKKMGVAAVPGAHAVALCQDLGIAGAPGQSPNNRLCLFAQLNEHDLSRLSVNVSSWEGGKILEPLLKAEFAKMPRIMFRSPASVNTSALPELSLCSDSKMPLLATSVQRERLTLPLNKLIGALLLMGGLFAYVRKGSLPSLLGGGVCGIALASTGWMVEEKPVRALQLATGISALLTAGTVVRTLGCSTGTMMPGGIVSLLGMVAFIYNFVKLRSYK